VPQEGGGRKVGAGCHNGGVEDLKVTERLTIPGRELRESFARSGGPGGQHVNKTETKVVLRWAPGTSEVLSDEDRRWIAGRLARKVTGDGDLVVTSDRTRDQTRNREDARRKLAALVRRALERPRPRKKTRPSRGARERRLGEKKRRGRIKEQRRGPADSRD
jgi:ribosome-associated protein